MKRRRALIRMLSIAMAFLPTANFGQSASPEILAGDYLSQRYLTVLEQTHSPFAAEDDRSINVVSVQKNDGSTDIVPIMNFHEAGPSFRIDRSGQGVLKDSAGLNVGQYLVRVLNNRELVVGFARYPTEKFVAVSDLQRIVRSKSVAGKYMDGGQRLYTFTEDGVATTPDGTFRFTVGTDHVPYRFDYIETADTHKILQFNRRKCTLDIYEVTDAVDNQHGNDGSHAKQWASLQEIGCKGN